MSVAARALQPTRGPVLCLAVAGAIATAPHATAAQRMLFEGCQVTFSHLPTIELDCGEASLSVTDTEREGSGPSRLERIAELSERPPGEVAKEERFTLELGGASCSAVRLVFARKEQWIVAVVDRPEGRRRLGCRERIGAESRCLPWMKAAARWGWLEGPPPSQVRRDTEFEFAGRRYPLPHGCDYRSNPFGGHVMCRDGTSLMWMEAQDWDPDLVISGTYSNAEARGTTPCFVEDVATKCRDAVARLARARILATELTVVRGKRIGVECVGRPPIEDLPAICRLVMSQRTVP